MKDKSEKSLTLRKMWKDTKKFYTLRASLNLIHSWYADKEEYLRISESNLKKIIDKDVRESIDLYINDNSTHLELEKMFSTYFTEEGVEKTTFSKLNNNYAVYAPLLKNNDSIAENIEYLEDLDNNEWDAILNSIDDGDVEALKYWWIEEWKTGKTDKIIIDAIDKSGNEIPLKKYTKQYLLSEGYLFALKHHLEREQYPIKFIQINQISIEKFKKILKNSNNIEETIKNEIRIFHRNLEREIFLINSRKEKEKNKILELEKLIEQYKEIFLNIDEVNSVYAEVIQKVEDVRNEIGNIEEISVNDIYNLDKYLKKYEGDNKLIQTTVNTIYYSQKRTISKLEARKIKINEKWFKIYSSIRDIKETITGVFDILTNIEGFTIIKDRFINLGYYKS